MRQLTPLPLATAERIPDGQPIVALGNPMGLRNSVVSGVVSGNREIDGRRMIQIALPIEPGNSGGPLLDLEGRVLGIVTLKSAVTANLGFATEVAGLRTLLEHPNPIPMSRWETIGSLDSSQWQTQFGARWQQRGGKIIASEPGDGFGGRSLCLWQRDLPQPVFEVGVYVKLDDESGAAGLIFNADGQDRHYGFYPSGGRLRLTRFAGSTALSWLVLKELPSPSYRPGQWNHLKVRIDAHQIACYVNDQLLLQHAEPGLSLGQVGLAKFRQTVAEFRDFRVEPRIEPTQLPSDRREKIQQQLAELKLDDWLSHEDVDRLSNDAGASLAVLEDQARQLQDRAARMQRLAADIHVRSVCRQLQELFARPESEIDLVRAALLVSQLDNRDLNVDAYVEQVDHMARDIAASLSDQPTPAQRLAALNHYLFTQNGFHGSRTNYYHEANSYFDRVLDDREGLPITLCLLYMELGRRLDLRIEGIGLPGHFVVRHVPPTGDAELLDVFNAGVRMSRLDAEFLSIQITGLPFREEYLQATSKQEITIRILRNLLGIAQRASDREAMLRYLEAMVAVQPDDAGLRGMRAIVRHETGRRQAAVDDLQWFLDQQPPDVDLDRIRAMKQEFELREPDR